MNNYMHLQETRFAEPEEIIKATNIINLKAKKTLDGGIPIISDGETIYSRGLDNNSITIGAPGSGKSRRVIAPTILSDACGGRSMIINDPKGELYVYTSAFLVEKGYKIHVLDFRNLNGDRWNPLRYGALLYKSGQKAKATEVFSALADTLFSDIKSDKDPFWEISSSQLFMGLVLMLCQEGNALKDVTLKNVYLAFLEGIERKGPDIALNQYINNFDVSLEIKANLSATCNAPNDTRMSIVSVFSSVLTKLVMNEELNSMLSHDSFSPSDLVNHKSAVFVFSRDESTVHNKLISTFIDQIYIRLVEHADKNNGKLRRGVDFLLDEFANISIANFPPKISACRSRDIRFHLGLQSFQQMEINYGKEMARVILANCNDILFLYSPEIEIIENISKRCGQYVEEFTGERRPLISTSQLQHLSKEKGEVLVLIEREYPYVTTLPDFSVYQEKLSIQYNRYVCSIFKEIKNEDTPFSLKKLINDNVCDITLTQSKSETDLLFEKINKKLEELSLDDIDMEEDE